MVLYHAISSYQLLEVMLHRYWNHRKEKAVLILPDFIQDKYPQYRSLENKNFFDRVVLFPYTQILHTGEMEIFHSVKAVCEKTFPCRLSEFHKIYVAGAHFYFSLYLIKMKIPFIIFEDAAGMLSHPEVLLEGLKKNYPVQAQIAVKYGLFTGDNPYISSVICLKKNAAAEHTAGKGLCEFFSGAGTGQFAFPAAHTIPTFVFAKKNMDKCTDYCADTTIYKSWVNVANGTGTHLPSFI